MKITIIQHVPFEVPGLIDQWITENRYERELVPLFENGYQLPTADTISFLVVLGGPMSANDHLPWIQAERQLIKEVVTAGKPMLGVCLGGQQLAKAFGSKVIPTPKEVGFGPVSTSQLAQRLFAANHAYQVLHWHGEGFEIPANASGLFSSQDWANQGFQLGSGIGLQFHLESTPATLSGLVAADHDFIPGSRFHETPNQILNTQFDPTCRTLLFQILNNLSTFCHVN